MPALIPTGHFATVTWVGLVPAEGGTLRANATDGLTLDWAGPVGDSHAGRTRASCSRVTTQYPRGTEIANVRQLSVLSAEELAEIAAKIGLDALDPALLGATLVLSGIPDFSHIPPSARLQAEGGPTLVVDMQNRPCHLPAREIEDDHAGHGKAFKTAAQGRRGVTAWVERPGRLAPGDRLQLHVPDQRGWAPGLL